MLFFEGRDQNTCSVTFFCAKMFSMPTFTTEQFYLNSHQLQWITQVTTQSSQSLKSSYPRTPVERFVAKVKKTGWGQHPPHKNTRNRSRCDSASAYFNYFATYITNTLYKLEMYRAKCGLGAVVFAIFVVGIAECALTLSGPKCGQKQCKTNEYCSRTDFFCKPCSEICDSSSHNYEEAECVKDCQGGWC